MYSNLLYVRKVVFMKNYVVKESPVEIKIGLARRTKETVMKYVWGIIIFFVFTDWVSSVLSHFFPLNTVDLIIHLYKNLNIDTTYLAEIAKRFPESAASSAIYMTFIGGIFLLGRCIFTLNYIRTLEYKYPLILSGFRFFWKAIMLNVLIAIFVALWSMLFVVPGIIAFYNYRQSFYILAENPEKSALQCIKESKFMMTGNKFNLFKLDLSYLFMIIILSIPSLIAGNLFDTTTLYGLMSYLIFSIPQYIAYASAYLGQGQFFILLKEGVYERDVVNYSERYDNPDIVLANNMMKIEDLRNVAGTLGIEVDESYSVDDLVNLINSEMRRGSQSGKSSDE